MSLNRARLPNRRGAELVEIEHAGVKYVAGLSRYTDGRVAEIFMSCAKAGSAMSDLSRDAAVLVSLALQHGADLNVLRRALTRSSDGTAAGPIGALLDLLADEAA